MRKLSALVADGMVELIAEAGWPVGEVIATESELKARFGVSRAVVREALGLVELRGVAAMKAGKGGGLMVAAPAREATVMALATFLEVADSRLEDMIQLMRRLESLGVDLAIERIDDDAAATLRLYAAEMAKPPGHVDADTAMFRAYRNALAGISGNPVLGLFVAAFQIALAGLSMSRFYKPTQFERHLESSRAIKSELIAALLACERNRAQAALRVDYGNQIASIRASAIGTMVQINDDAERHGMKLPRWIALQISRRIADGSLQPGALLGSESELMAQFGVGRSVLREAIRMLEAYSVVTMRRGQGGGLRVGSPDPAPTFRAVVQYLRSVPGSAGHAFEVRRALEVDAAGLAAERCNVGAIAALRRACDGMTALCARDPAQALAALTAVSRAIAEASGDRVLDFFVSITQQIQPELRPAGPPEASAAILRLGPIVEAIAVGDRSEARRLMHQHLRALRPLVVER